jgi:hypothetical protein
MTARSIILTTFLATLVACSGAGNPPGEPHCLAIAYDPLVTLLSPRPGATGLATGQQTLIFQSVPNGTPSAGPVPIRIAFGNAASVATTPTAVPSPLPSDAASPVPGPNPSATPVIFAVSADLSNVGTYEAIGPVTITGCETGTTETTVGTFSTQ